MSKMEIDSRQNDEGRVLVVIPARGGSKGIPRKNLRLLAGNPLVVHVIKAAHAATKVDRVVVTTDDDEIAAVATRAGAEIIRRPSELAGDTVTLDPVVYHAVRQVEAGGYRPDVVLTVQPTSPLLRSETIDQASRLLLSGQWDTVISAVDNTHLFWSQDAEGRFMPMYAERLNRQFLPPVYRETGGIIGCRREALSEKGRVGQRVTLIELAVEEAVDIDTFFDWWIAEKTLARRHLVLRVDGDRSIGLGHVYRCLSLAASLTDHKVTFLMDSRFPLGAQLVRERHFPIVEFEGDVFPVLRDLQPDILVNDILDTDAAYVRAAKELNAFVVNFEDLGVGADEAHLVINALYDSPMPRPSHVWGAEYDCLRGEFYTVPTKQVESTVQRVLLTFGGTDQANLTTKTLRALDNVRGDFEVEVILGLGYGHSARLEKLMPYLKRQPTIRHNVRSMSQHILDAGLVVTSAGRTVLEVMSIGTPCLVLCQNEREMRHLHARSEYGIVNLGLGLDVSEFDLTEALQRLLDDAELRREMSRRMLNVDVRGGCERVIKLIMDRYYIFDKEQNR